jgi:hypothetical protein
MKHVQGKLAEAIRKLQSDASAKLCIIFDSFSVSPAEAESSGMESRQALIADVER